MANIKVAESTKGLMIENPNATRNFELEKLEMAIQSVDQMLEHRRQVPREKSDEMYYILVGKYLRAYREAKENGTPVVMGANKAILNAMGLVNYSSQPVAVTMAHTQGMHTDILNAATEAGLFPFLCSVSGRLGWGGMVRGMLMPPDLIISSSVLCTTFSTGHEFWAHWAGVPVFRLDRPYKFTENAVKYYHQQLLNCIHWLEEHTGHKMDWDKLAENVEYSRQLTDLRMEIHELRKATPHPMRSRHASHMEIMGMYWAGGVEAVEYFTQVRDEMKERVEKGVGFVPEEKIRLLCNYMPPTHSLSIFDWWEREWGAVSVIEPWFSFNPRVNEMDPSRPLESLARTAFWGYFGSCGETIMDDTVRMAKEYKADGAVYYAPAQCNEHINLIQTIRDRLKKEADIPTLVVDVDYCDPTYMPQEEIRQRTEPFFEMLRERKGN